MQEATRTAEDLQRRTGATSVDAAVYLQQPLILDRLIETAHACIVGIDPAGNVNEWNHHIVCASGAGRTGSFWGYSCFASTSHLGHVLSN